MLPMLLPQYQRLVGHDPVMNVHEDEMSKFKGWSGYVSATSIYASRSGIC